MTPNLCSRLHPLSLVVIPVLSLMCLPGCGTSESRPSPLEEAAAVGDPSRILGLVQRGMDPNSLGPDRIAPLAVAARSGQIASIRALIEAGADPDLRDDRNGWTPLLHAVHKHQKRSIEALLALGADPDRGTRAGYTPLMMAAGYGYPETVRLLLEHGADPRLTQRSGENALLMAATGSFDIDRFTLGQCQAETVRALLEHDPALSIPDTPLARLEFQLVKLRRCEEVLALLEQRREP